jgi:hypothetical protein
MPANQPAKREKSKGFCSRVSTRIVARGAFSCVPPRSAKTGIAAGATGTAAMCRASGDLIKHPVYAGAADKAVNLVGCKSPHHYFVGLATGVRNLRSVDNDSIRAST